MEKKVYQTPEVIKVEYDASDRITASYCHGPDLAVEISEPDCRDQ